MKVQIFREDSGQDLIEYALVVALIAFAATAGMSTVAEQDQRGVHHHRQQAGHLHQIAFEQGCQTV